MGKQPNPYVGPSPFEQTDSPWFYGRDGEASELFSLTCAHPVVLFYSQSGAGKTSLINAGVIPRLKAEQIDVFPVARVGVKLPKDASTKRIANVFVFNTLLSLEGKEKQRKFNQLGKMSLADYLKEQKHNGQRAYFHPLRVLIFDQFEELFTSFTEHWPKRESFFAGISEALKQDPFLRVVFAMREEYIAELEPFAPMLPLRLQKRFRLERLRKDAAKRAIEGPLENTDRTYDRNVADTLVNNLLRQKIKDSTGTRPTIGEFVEPVQLQIVCRSLWEELPDEVKVIDQKAVSLFGDVDAALAKYYDDCLKKIVKEAGANEARLRLWFRESLITPVNTRATAYVDEGGTAGLSPRSIKMLEEQRLIRPELRGGAKWYELTHDRFIEPILQSNKQWFGLLSEGGPFIYELEQKAMAWNQGGRTTDTLLTEDVIQKFKNTAKYDDKLDAITPSKLLEDFVKESETAADKKKSKEFRNQVVLSAVAGVLLVGLVAYAIISSIRITQRSRATATIQSGWGRQASEYAEVSGKEFDGLVKGLEAFTLSDPEDAPTEAVEGLRAAVAAVDRKVWLRDGRSAASRLQIMKLSADGTLALTVNNVELCVWDTLTGQKTFEECIVRPKGGAWSQAQFSPDGKFVYAVVAPLQLATKREPVATRVDQPTIDTSVTPLDQSLVWVIDARTGESLEKVQSQLQGADSLEVSQDSGHVMADFGDVRIIDVPEGNVHVLSRSKQALWDQIALSSDGSRLVAVYGGARVDLVATDSGSVVDSFNVGIAKSGKYDVISFSTDGKYGVLVRPSPAGGEASGLVWENATGKRIASFKSKARNVEYVAVASDNSVILVSDQDLMEVIEVSTGRLLSSSDLPDQGISLQAGLKIFSVQSNNRICNILVWNASNLLSPSQYSFSTKSEITMAESASDRIMILDEDKSIQIWTLKLPPATARLDVEQLINAGCQNLRNRKKEFPQFDSLCRPRVQSW